MFFNKSTVQISHLNAHKILCHILLYLYYIIFNVQNSQMFSVRLKTTHGNTVKNELYPFYRHIIYFVVSVYNKLNDKFKIFINTKLSMNLKKYVLGTKLYILDLNNVLGLKNTYRYIFSLFWWIWSF